MDSMNKVLFLIFTFLFFVIPKNTYAVDTWVINKFDSEINILRTGEIVVHETINVDFGNLEKHGIYRDLPYIYENGNEKIYTEVNVGEVLQDGKPADVKTITNDNFINIRIGDADKTINGKHLYKISYSVKGVLKPFDDYDELYWNITGNGWEAPISSVSATVKTPSDAITSTVCFEGYNSATWNCNNQIVNPTEASFASTRQLGPYEGLTIATAFKKGVFPILKFERPKTFFEKILTFPSETTFLTVLILGSAAVFFFWWKNGRDSWSNGITGYLSKKTDGKTKPLGAHEPVVVEFTPPEKLPPALIGVIMDERADTLDVTATIIDLASRGFLTITEIPKKWLLGNIDYSLKKTEKDKTNLLGYEKELLTRLFTKDEIKISELKTTFYNDLAKVKEKLYEEVVERKFFQSNPEKIRSNYFLAGLFILIGSGVIAFLSISSEIVLLFDLSFASVLIGIFIMIFSKFMPRRTAYGREVYRRIKGYRMFIASAEKYRQKFFEEKNMFNEVLPYTIIFGLTAKYAKALKDMGLKPTNPSWYHGTHAFSMVHFSNSVTNFSGSLSSAISSAPKSSGFSGGGSSGGGFGGGGGGSW